MELKIYLLFGLLLLNAVAVRCETDPAEQDTPTESNGDEETETLERQEILNENDVLILTNDNFENALEENNIILVEFYAPWCGHCKTLAPEYEKAAASLKKHELAIPLAKVDATVESDVAQEYGVSGYPTLKFFKNGDVVDYDGPRDAQGIVEWVLERSDPSWEPPADEVVVLTKDNFEEFIEEHDLSLVEFYAPWCGHCKKLAPQYARAARYLKENTDPPVMLAKVDATEQSDLAAQYDVTGYPTMIMFRKGKKYTYKGGQDEWTIIDYLEKQVGPASRKQATVQAVKTSIVKDDVTIVGFFDNEEATEYNTYQNAANELREDFRFHHTFDSSIRKEFKANPNSIILFSPEQFHSKHEPKWRNYELKEDTEASEITDFINQNCLPLVAELTDTTKEKRYKDIRPLVIVFYSVDFSFEYRKATQMWRNKIVEIAKDYKDLTFTVADETKMASLCKEFGLDDSGEEINIGILGDKDRKYPMELMEEYDEDHIRDFIKKFQAGKAKPIIKSQPKPKKQGSVVTVVGKTFEEIVFDKSKDVLIEFYAPWCGHCKDLEPIYKELGKKYKKVKDLVIAKIDGTANDLPPGYDSTGYPTIFLAAKDQKETPQKYEGARTLDDLVEFLEENSSALKTNQAKVEL